MLERQPVEILRKIPRHSDGSENYQDDSDENADKPRENLRQADEQNTQHAQRCGHHDIADLCGSHR